MTTPEESWVVDARPVIPELDRSNYVHAVYVAPSPTFFPSIAERLDTVMRERLIEFARGVQ